MRRQAMAGVAGGLAVLWLLGSPVGAQGPSGRRPAGPLLVVDDQDREVGPVIGQVGGLALAALAVGGEVYPVEVAADRILVGLGTIVFTTPGCQGAAFLFPRVGLNGNGVLKPEDQAPARQAPATPTLFASGGIGPGNQLLGPQGATLQVQVQSRWDSFASPPQCEPFVLIGSTDVFATRLVLDLDVFKPPFHLRRP